jgi:hypothetical protein
MAVGKQSSTAVTVSLTDAAAAAQAIGGFIMDLGAAEIEVEQESSESFGDSWREFTPTGMRKSAPIAVKGHFDTTLVTGPHVVLRPGDADALPGATPRVLVIVFGDSKTFTVSVRIQKYRVVPTNGKLTQFEATLQPTGAAVWS